ncbi:MAG: sigma-70 family RNA polymerase sigma factor [Prolixibacteraceae bacterium]|jgi:RNA polymerase sigma factor (sigma-70 family)|nr:sigma-70 family RNA polymerase sigma factor [Prolixibacteraceae bacterium]
MINYSNEELLNGILRNDNVILQHIYKNFYYKVNLYIKKNSGNDEDANDVFQEAIIVVYRKLKANDLTINCAFETYLYSVCKFLWLKQLTRQRTEKEMMVDSATFESEFDHDFSELVEKNERFKLYQKHFQLLGSDCQKLLQLFFDKVPLKQIAQIMGFSGEKYVKKRKFKCKEYLVTSIKQDVSYKRVGQ